MSRVRIIVEITEDEKFGLPTALASSRLFNFPCIEELKDVVPAVYGEARRILDALKGKVLPGGKPLDILPNSKDI